jgi:hypothetical protein
VALRTPILVIAGLCLTICSDAEAITRSHRHGKDHIHRPSGYAPRLPAFPDSDGWYPHDSNELPGGSFRWWDQMLRENRRNPG